MNATISAGDLRKIAQDFIGKGHTHPLVLVHSSEDPGVGEQLGPESKTVHVRYAATPLALRYFVKDFAEKREQNYASIVVTPLRDDQVPLDVADALTRRNIIRVDGSSRLRQLFSATRQRRGIVEDTRDIQGIITFLTRESAPPVEAAGAGLLDHQHVNRQIIRSLIGGAYPTSIRDILSWSLTDGASAVWAYAAHTLSEAVREAAMSQLQRDLGDAATLVATLLTQQGPSRLVEFGLIAEMVVRAGQFGVAEQSDAVNFRHLVGLTSTPATKDLERWADAACDVASKLARHNVAAQRAVTEAERTATTEGAFDNPRILIGSTMCPGAYRLLADYVASGLDDARIGQGMDSVLSRYQQLTRHVNATLDDRDRQASEAALRLLIHAKRGFGEQPRDVAGYLESYRDELSWFDSAVNHAWDGGNRPALTDVTRAIAEDGREQRATLNRQAAATLSTAVATAPIPGGVLGVEDVLGAIVKPLVTASRPVLVVVLDGMNAAAANDIVSHITQQRLWQVAHPDSGALRTAVATLPTVTTFSRTSLLSGALVAGTQHDEKKNFTAWFSANVRSEVRAQRAELFHKDAVDGAFDTVVEAVRDVSERPLVGVVLNTIDDALDKDKPMSRIWTIDSIFRLTSLLHEAAEAGREVVLVSDHGHIVERHTADLTNVESSVKSARWRDTTGDTANEGEVFVRGNRVLAPGGEAILGVDEDVRYTSKKAGYHGGLALEELVVPIVLLTRSDALEDHTVSYDLEVPVWWAIPEPGSILSDSRTGTTTSPAPTQNTASKSVPANQQALDFGTANGPITPWARSLIKDKYFRARTQSVSGVTPDKAGEMLFAIADHVGRMPVATFRERFGMKNVIARGTLSKLQQVVNMDGVEVLYIDGNDIVLNAKLLCEQFGIKEWN
ncbi:BREX-2 system phosphatase PglZ [Corynebacterium breve]|uniref:BREX-2 system phosphatase PglZ n=1 Tax=Corynebacterium breve TaxID=3049799 RepID=A0ABY8VFV2_9CORY|nr:BREX-2 system phosphatase PglZ [Corynebacterium breve]WIM67645.1 BREX-2 system phosphatase PglZ [Corynebacterium breve]